MTSYIWTNNDGNDLWSDQNNWSPTSGPPGSGDDAVIGTGKSVVESGTPNGSVDQLLLGANLGTVFPTSLTVENSGFNINGASSIFADATLAVDVNDAIYFFFTGDLTNAGTLLLGQVTNSGGNGSVGIDGSVMLTGGGTVDLGQQSNALHTFSTGSIVNFFGDNDPDALINVNNTISGGGSIDLTTFDNQAGGIVQASQGEGNSLQIYATTFTNEGTMVAESRAVLDLGLDGESGSLTNTGSILINSDGRLAISGNFIIGGSGVVGAVGSADIVSDGMGAASLFNESNIQFVGGSGQIGDEGVLGGNDLTFENGDGGTVLVEGSGSILTLNTGSNAIIDTELGTFLAEGGGQMNVDSAVTTGGSEHFSGGHFIGGGGTIEALDGGTVIISSAITPGTGIAPYASGQILIEGGTVVMATGATDTTPINFSGGGTLQLNSAANTVGTIGGTGLDDVIDLRYLSFAAGDQAVFSSGTLSLENSGGATLASFTLSGSYSSANFIVTSDGSGGTEIEYVNPPPPAATTADMIMRDGSNGNYEIYDIGNNAIQAAYALGQVGTEWQVAGLGGFDGTDTSDMILRDVNNGDLEVYDISNNNITNSTSMGQVGLAWVVSGFGDFSGNPGETDMLMQNTGNGDFEVYDISNNTITFASGMGQVGLAWTVAGFGDFSGHAGETGDMLMRNASTGQFEVYDISNNAITFATGMGQVGLEWSVAGFGDFSGNANETDMLMRNSNTGAFELYDISNNAITFAGPMGQVGLEWSVVGFGPIDGTGTSDMLMRNTNTGAFEIFDIGNNQILNAAPRGQVGNEWSVAGIAADPPGGSAPANAQLVQAMASMGTSAPISAANTAPIGSETSVQTPLTMPQPG